MLQKCAFENFSKITKRSFERLQRTQGVPKSFWRKFRGFLSKYLKILCFVQFLGTVLCMQPFTWRGAKKGLFKRIFDYFTLVFTKRLHTKYQESAQKSKFFRFCSKIIQTFPSHILDLPGYSGGSEIIFLRFFCKISFSQVR